MKNTEIKLKAKVIVKSLFGERKREYFSIPLSKYTEPKNPGSNANKFAKIIKTKKVATSGKTCLVILVSCKTELIKSKTFSTNKKTVLTASFSEF